MKGQQVRLLDVFFLGPVMTYTGLRARGIPPWVKMIMVLGGVMTIAYNGQNYLIEKKLQETADRLEKKFWENEKG